MNEQSVTVVDLAPQDAPAPVPPCWDERLPAGEERRIRVCKADIGLAHGRPFTVSGQYDRFAAILIEGPSRSEHDVEEHTASLVTCASILVRREPA